jgi:hypothetical protein
MIQIQQDDALIIESTLEMKISTRTRQGNSLIANQQKAPRRIQEHLSLPQNETKILGNKMLKPPQCISDLT